MPMPLAIDLFAGAGGASIGLQRAGYDVLAVERDPDAVATHNLHSPCVLADVGDLDTWLPAIAGRPVHVMQAGFPCQPFSSAGKRAGAGDSRDGWPPTLAAIDTVKPTWFLGENVRGLTFHSRTKCGDWHTCPGCYLARIIGQLEARFAHVSYRVLDAADYGVPQRRRRVFIVAGPEPYVWPAPTHAGRWVSMGEALGLRYPVRHQSPSAGTIQRMPSEPSPAVGTKGTLFAEATTQSGSHNPAYHSRRASEPERLDKPARGENMRGGPDRASDAAWLGGGRRRLTVSECATLQAFPVGMTFTGTQTSQYRQVGNAVPPILIERLTLNLRSISCSTQ